ncbi:MAG: sugar ABC transporter permease [Anaerolineaceae bacterium]
MNIQKLKKKMLPYQLIAPAIIIMAVFVYYPVIQNIYLSLFRWSAIDPSMRFIGLENYFRILGDRIVGVALRNNVLYAVISVIFQVGVSLILAAIIEAKILRPRWATFFRNTLFTPAVLAITVVGITFQLIYSPNTGLINQLLEVIGLENLRHAWLGEESTAIYSIIAVSQWQWVGYDMILFIVAIQAIPEELYEAASIDGANGIQQFFHVTIPMVWETILVLMTITVIGGFKVFDIIWVMTAGGPNHASETLGNYLYRVGFRNDEMGYAAALATVLFVITLLLTVVQQRIGKSGSEALNEG